jgi:hypothetical protein
MKPALQIYFEKNDIKPTPWAIKNGIAASVISRYLQGRGISTGNALKISQACFGEVTVLQILYPDRDKAA